MAGSKTGTASIWRHTVKIVQLKQKYGAADIEARLGTPFKDCLNALVNCAVAVMASDDYVLQIDRTLPLGPEDV
jgi:hypothetical protein